MTVNLILEASEYVLRKASQKISADEVERRGKIIKSEFRQYPNCGTARFSKLSLGAAVPRAVQMF